MSMLAYAPDDLTVRVTADTTLAELQEHLATRNQWLPVDPCNPWSVTVGQIIDGNLSGPRRYGYGTIREHVLSLRAELADGRQIKAGADVVKNAAGYDLCRLLTGACGELATVREVCFKVQPQPEVEQFVCASFASMEAAWKLVEDVDTSPLTPVVLDLHNSSGAGPWIVVIGFAGMREEVAWQRADAERFSAMTDADLTHDAAFWAQTGASPVRKLSVLPSTLLEAIHRLDLQTLPLLARAGNGILFYRGESEPGQPAIPLDLMRRMRHEFDPRHELPRRS